MNKAQTAGKNIIRNKASDKKGVVLRMNNRIRNNSSRKSAAKRERIIMIVSSAFVMAALTMTGIYMKEKSEQERNDGYSMDLAQLDTNIEDKYQELAEGIEKTPVLPPNVPAVPEDTTVANGNPVEEPNMDVELDYMPMEGSVIDVDPITAVGSGQVEISPVEDVMPEIVETEEPTIITPELFFSEEEGLIRPVQGEILMHYNMDSTVYFQTLDQYKYNPAVIFQAQQGSHAVACADGQVIKLYQNEEIGAAMVIDLGNGYEVTYGQLAAYNVKLGDYVTAGQVIATIAAPTKYYVTEGGNLYFALEKNGVAVNPEGMLAQ